MAFEPNMKRRANLVKLREYVASAAAGARVSWVEVEQATGVEMRDQLSRNLFRSACHREKRGYIALPGGGVEFSSASNALECVGRYFTRVNGAIQSAAEKSGYVVERHASEITGDAGRELLRRAALISLLANIAKPKSDAMARPKPEPEPVAVAEATE